MYKRTLSSSAISTLSLPVDCLTRMRIQHTTDARPGNALVQLLHFQKKPSFPHTKQRDVCTGNVLRHGVEPLVWLLVVVSFLPPFQPYVPSILLPLPSASSWQRSACLIKPIGHACELAWNCILLDLDHVTVQASIHMFDVMTDIPANVLFPGGLQPEMVAFVIMHFESTV